MRAYLFDRGNLFGSVSKGCERTVSRIPRKEVLYGENGTYRLLPVHGVIMFRFDYVSEHAYTDSILGGYHFMW